VDRREHKHRPKIRGRCAWRCHDGGGCGGDGDGDGDTAATLLRARTRSVPSPRAAPAALFRGCDGGAAAGRHERAIGTRVRRPKSRAVARTAGKMLNAKICGRKLRSVRGLSRA